jgi:hypothetical protein
MKASAIGLSMAAKMVHQVVAAADQGAQRLDLVRGGHQGTEGMPVGAQDVGQHEGIARIAFAASGAVAGPACFDDVGMDRDNRVPGRDQGLDDQAGWPLDGNGQLSR